MTDFRAKVYMLSADDHRNYQACYPTAVDKAMDVIFDRLNGLPLEQLIGFLRRGNAGPNGCLFAAYEIADLEKALDDRAELWEESERENAGYARADWELDCRKAEGY